MQDARCKIYWPPVVYRHEEPDFSRHAWRLQHRRRTTVSRECHLSLLPLGKSRRARPDVAFRGRVGGGWGRSKGARRRPPARIARRRAAGAKRARPRAPTRACSRRRLRPRPRGRGQRPRTAGVSGSGLGKKRPGARPGRLLIMVWLDDYSRTTRVTRRFAARPALVELSAIGLYSPYDVEFIRNRGRPASMLR